MKILFICPQNPYYSGSGAHQRSLLLLKSIIELGHQVDVIFIDKRYNNEDKFLLKNSNLIASFDSRKNKIQTILYYLRYLLGFGIKLKRKQLIKIIKQAIQNTNYDYIITRYIDTIQEGGLEQFNNLIVDIDDSPEEVYKVRYNTTSNLLLKYWYHIAQKNAVRYLKKHEKSFTLCFYPQQKQCTHKNSFYLPNIPIFIPDIPIEQPKATAPYLLYVGVMSWMPNYLGMNYFIDNIWPTVKQQNPHIILKIVGKGLPLIYQNKWKNDKQIEILGFVENLSPVYQNASLVIAPIYQGGGTNIKVLEAMAYRKAIVLSPHATRGFEHLLEDNKNIMIGKDDNDFAKKIHFLLTDSNLKNTMENEARILVEKNFSYTSFKNQISQALEYLSKK